MAAGAWLVVSVHDVAPATLADVRYLLDALDEMGARPRVLKVIPNLDSHGDVRDDPALLRLLADEVAAGSEVLLHGYTHRAAAPLRGPWPRRVRARLFAGTAAEFLTLDSSTMHERLDAGRQILRDCGVEPRGFCAPCWLAAPELPALLRRGGFAYYVTMATLLDLATGRRVPTPWLGYMGADALQERLVGIGARACLGVARPLPLVKVFLHPQGARSSPACARTLHTLAGLLRMRAPTTFGEYLAR